MSRSPLLTGVASAGSTPAASLKLARDAVWDDTWNGEGIRGVYPRGLIEADRS